MGKSKMKKLQELCHKIAVEKGFWDVNCRHCMELITPKELAKFPSCPYCFDSQLDPRNDAEMLMLMVSELGEACEGLRKGDKKNVAEELADCVIRIMDYSEARNIDIEKEILKKCKKNKKRKYKHGKRF